MLNILQQLFDGEHEKLANYHRLFDLFNPFAALRRGYAIVTKGQMYVHSIGQVADKDRLNIRLSDGTIQTEVKGLNNG